MGFESQRAKYAVLGLLAVAAFIVIVFVYILCYAAVFALCYSAARVMLDWAFAESTNTAGTWWKVAALAIAVVGTAAAGRAFDILVRWVRRLRGKETIGKHAATPRQNARDLILTGVDWGEMIRHLVVMIPALVGSVYIIGYTVGRWIDLPNFVLMVLAVFLAAAISYPCLRVQEWAIESWKRRRSKP